MKSEKVKWFDFIAEITTVKETKEENRKSDEMNN